MAKEFLEGLPFAQILQFWNVTGVGVIVFVLLHVTNVLDPSGHLIVSVLIHNTNKSIVQLNSDAILAVKTESKELVLCRKGEVLEPDP